MGIGLGPLMSEDDEAGDMEEVIEDSRDRSGRHEMNLAVEACWTRAAESIARIKRSTGSISAGGSGDISRGAK